MNSENETTKTESVCSSIGSCDTSSETSLASLTSVIGTRTTPWPIVDSPTITDVDFGSLLNCYDPQLFICFYNDPCGNGVCRIGDFYDVPLNEAVRALNAQPHYVQSTNLVVRFDSCREGDFAVFLPVLKLLLFRCQINSGMSKWKRCALLMVDYKFALKVVKVLTGFTDRILELNIGSVQLLREQRQRCDIDEEANCIISLLTTWLKVCYPFLRCLRIFAFVRLDFELSLLLSKCLSLTHLTLARFSDITCPVFNTIRSFEFNGCGMGYTDQDLSFAKNLVKYFPFVKVIAFREVCFDPVLTSLIRHLAQTGGRYDLYQFVPLKQFVSLVRTAFTIKSMNENDDHVELVSERYGTCLFVYDNHHIFRTSW